MPPLSQSVAALGLAGTETFAIEGIAKDLKPRGEVTVTAKTEGGETKRFKALVRIDTPVEIEYYRFGGILPYVLIGLLAERQGAAVAA